MSRFNKSISNHLYCICTSGLSIICFNVSSPNTKVYSKFYFICSIYLYFGNNFFSNDTSLKVYFGAWYLGWCADLVLKNSCKALANLPESMRIANFLRCRNRRVSARTLSINWKKHLVYVAPLSRGSAESIDSIFKLHWLHAGVMVMAYK